MQRNGAIVVPIVSQRKCSNRVVALFASFRYNVIRPVQLDPDSNKWHRFRCRPFKASLIMAQSIGVLKVMLQLRFGLVATCRSSSAWLGYLRPLTWPPSSMREFGTKTPGHGVARRCTGPWNRVTHTTHASWLGACRWAGCSVTPFLVMPRQWVISRILHCTMAIGRLSPRGCPLLTRSS